VKRVALILVAAATLAATADAQPRAMAAPPSFAFGRLGGNIRPLDVKIASSGRVTVDGAAAQQTVKLAKRRALLTLARNQGFFKLRPTIVCPGTNPDIASLYVSIHSGRTSHRVQVHGACSRRFNAVYSAVAATVGMP
jgi:hypothetical protein